jgi:hypothetical protein
MENNRRSFFKGLAAFASGVVAAKVSTYVLKKEEPKEEQMVTNYLTITHEGVEYHPLVVKKTDADRMMPAEKPKNEFGIVGYKATIRKANV